MDRLHNAADGAFLVEGGDDHQQRVGTCRPYQSAATFSALMAWQRSRWRKIAGVIRARRGSRAAAATGGERAQAVRRELAARTRACCGPALPSARKRAALPRPSSRNRACQK